MKVVLAYSGGLDTSVILHWIKQTYDAADAQLDGWVADTLGEQSSLVDREDLLLDVESMVADGMSTAQIEGAIRRRMENVQTRGLDSLSGGTIVEGFGEADVVGAGLAHDRRAREDTEREVLDTLQVTLGVGSDEDFRSGEDRVHYRVDGVEGQARVRWEGEAWTYTLFSGTWERNGPLPVTVDEAGLAELVGVHCSPA